MHFVLEVWRSLTDPDRLIHLLTQVLTGWLGYGLLAFVVFAETGLLVGLFLPGDSLLFTVGVVCGAGDLDIVKICALLTVVSILGDQSGYFLGYRTGPTIFSRPDSRFLSFNIFGGLGWVLSATLAGYYLGGIPVVRHNFEKVVIAIAVISVLPMVIHYFQSRGKSSPAGA